MTADESLARICAAAACALAMLLLVVCGAVAAWRRSLRRLFDRRDEWADMMCRRAARAEKELANFKRVQK